MNAESHENASKAAEKAVVESSARRVYRLLNDAIGSIGGLEVAAGLCGINDGDLRRSLDRNGRRVAVEHAIAIGSRVSRFNATLATTLGSALVETFNLEVFPRVTLKLEDRVERLERLVLSMPLGEQLLANAYGGRR